MDMKYSLKSIMFISILFCGTIACKKKVLEKSQIKMGESKKMIIKQYDTTLTGKYNEPVTYTLDLNNDGGDDVIFENKLWGSPAVGMNYHLSVTSLDKDVQFYGIHKTDTTFLNEHVEWHIEQNDYTKYVTLSYSCHKTEMSDKISEIKTDAFKLTFLNKNEAIKMDETFSFENVSLHRSSLNNPLTNNSSSGDTTIIERSLTYFNCNPFPVNQMKYIGVKFANKSKLGWIRILILDKKKILILDSGIQK